MLKTDGGSVYTGRGIIDKREETVRAAVSFCYDCKSPERICRGLSVLWGKLMTGEFEVILINEVLEY